MDTVSLFKNYIHSAQNNILFLVEPYYMKKCTVLMVLNASLRFYDYMYFIHRAAFAKRLTPLMMHMCQMFVLHEINICQMFVI